MIKNTLIGLFAGLLILASCQNQTATPPSEQAALRLISDENPELTHENLRIYPITASDEVIARGVRFAHWKTVDEALQTPGFRITELKQFGRQSGNWYNGLTVQNKSADTVFIQSGDVVTGGNQDRVNQHDIAVLPHSIKNITVFCVEHGRSSYYNPDAPAAEKQLAAFKGYYNVASPEVRKAVNRGDQGGVWSAVSSVTTANKADNATSAYAGLEADNEYKTRRENMVRYFVGKLDHMNDVVGLIAVCDGEVIGAEAYAHPDLFKRRSAALLHSYAVEAAARTPQHSSDQAPAEAAQHQLNLLLRAAMPQPFATEQVGVFAVDGQWVHLFGK